MASSQLTTFIGRTQELTDITTRLADSACRLLTLVGPGGIGKTRLALEAAQSFAEADSKLPSPLRPTEVPLGMGEGLGVRGFPHGIHFVPLQPVSNANLLPVAIANTIGIQFFGADEPRVQLLNYLRERQTLLILDNFEHLLEGVDLVVELLTAPGLKLLVTSRAALNVQAEWRYQVDGLEIPGEAALRPYNDLLRRGDPMGRPVENDFENFDAVKLFTERARRLRHDFSPADHRADLIRICQLTEGMPLALELAAGWLKALSCAQIADEIQRGLDFLAANARDMPERHRSMAAAFAQSWELLTDDEQNIFRRMSVFRGGFTREAAEKVTDATLQILASLVDKSLLRVNSAGRYDLHELLRQYGEAKLAECGEIEAIRDAHSTYYLNFLAQRTDTIHSHKMIEVLDEIEADFENIRDAWDHAVTKQNDQVMSCAVDCFTWFCNYRNRAIEHEELCSRAQKRFAPLPGEHPRLVSDH